MALQQRLSLSPKLSQRLVLTPAMQQAIKLLPLTTLELADVINQEIVENPLLEEIPDDDTAPEVDPDAEFSETALTAEGEFEAEFGELPAETALAEPVPATDLSPPSEAPAEPAAADQTSLQDSDLDKLFENVVDDVGVRDMAKSDPDSEYSLENRLSTSVDLREHLLTQLRHAAHPGLLMSLAEGIIQNLDDDGYLRTHDPSCEAADHAACGKIVPTTLEEVCKAMEIDFEKHQATAEKALHLVQTFDPAGVGARDLKECLLIQLRFFGFGATPAVTIVTNHMRMLEMRDVAGLVRVLQRPEAEVLDWLDLIESLDPRPGSTLSAKPPSYVVPDVTISKKDGVFEVELNDDSLPRLRISSSYRQFLSGGAGGDGAAAAGSRRSA